MLIVNYQRLIYEEAIKDAKHPMNIYAKEYDEGIKRLRKLYPEGSVRLLRQGFPKFIDGITGSGKEVRDIPEPIPPMRFSLKANVVHPQRGNEQWAVCLGAPKPMPGGLWDLDTPKSKQITDGMTIDLFTEPDMAYFICYKSPHVTGGHWKIDDPKADIRAKGDLKREALDRETAIWQKLQDVDQLRKVAQGYGIEDAMKKEPDTIRFELDALLLKNDEKKQRDVSIRGTKEFLEDLKITDYMRLSAFIRNALDNSTITWKPDGKYRVGDRVIAHVPHNEINEKFKWLCNYFDAPNNNDKLRELLHDIVNKVYVESIVDDRDFRWLAKVFDLPGAHNKEIEQVKGMLYEEFGL